MFSLSSNGSFDKTEAYLRSMQKLSVERLIEPHAQRGVDALESATPTMTGRAAGSWGYTIEKSGGSYVVSWTNNDIENGFPVVIMLQYGHGTGTGGYVQGRDFINPAIKPIFDEISNAIWKAVTSV